MSYVQYDSELNEHLEQFSRDILTKKEKKILRDQNAFQEQKAHNRGIHNLDQKPILNKDLILMTSDFRMLLLYLQSPLGGLQDRSGLENQREVLMEVDLMRN